MAKIISGTFNGTGATVYLCIGFIPDEVEIVALEDSENATARWSKHYRAADQIGGSLAHNSAVPTLYTGGQGIQVYEGGEQLTATNQTSTTYAEGVFLGWDTTDYRNAGTMGLITSWTLGSSSNRTGNFNLGVNTTYVGEGSRVLIGNKEGGQPSPKWYTITALSNYGNAANEVTLDRAPLSGDVLLITGMYSLKPLALNSVTPAGIKLLATTEVNVNDEIQWFKAIQHDN